MKVWLVTIGEPVPVMNGSQDRLHRTGSFGRFLARKGHDTLWWTSAFDHIRKRFIPKADSVTHLDGGMRIRFLRGCGYRRNVSARRFIDHCQIARRFAAEAENEERPDVIVAALPTVELCLASIAYGERYKVPVILDMRDMWPDIFVDAAPRSMRPLAHLLLLPLFHLGRRACSKAAAITGITEEFVDWGLLRGRRSRGELDRAFPMSYDSAPLADWELEASFRFWAERGVRKEDPFATVCYFGNVNRQLDLHHVIEAAKMLSSVACPVRFVLCGQGERLGEYRNAAAGLPNVVFPGWVGKAQIQALMSYSVAGLDPLPDRYDYLATINNKAIEYLSAGLPILSSPRHGVLYELITHNQCGATYDPASADGLATLAKWLVHNREMRLTLAANARRVFEQRFTAETVYESMSEYLKEVVDSCRPNR